MSQESWTGVLNLKVKILLAQAASMQSWAEKSGGGEDLVEKLCAPYYHLIEEIYTEDFPVARAIESSDLLLHLEGSALKQRHPRISLIATVFSSVRKQVGSVAYALAGVLEKTTLPKDVDLGLTAFAPGSVYLGFSLPDPGSEDEKGERSLLGEEDPLYKATRQAIHALGIISKQVETGASLDEIAKEFPDPKVRDAALTALHQLAPTGRIGIDSVGLCGRGMADRKFRTLTPTVRKKLKPWTEHPVQGGESGEFTGTVREIDLDVQRIELRQLVGTAVEEIRCVYPVALEAIAKDALTNQKQVRASGKVERGADNRPRLLELQRLEIVG